MKLLTAVIASMLALTGCQTEAPEQVFATENSSALESLPIKGRAPMTGYDRSLFPHWTVINGCDTRSRILERDSIPGTQLRTDKGCVNGARIDDPYSGKVIVEEQGAASEVDIDHVVALGDAWQKGAQQLTTEQRRAFANDPLNLLAVDDYLNRQKGDGDAASWLPPNRSFRCEYVSRQVDVKVKYQLWVTQAEHDAIADVLSTCYA